MENNFKNNICVYVYTTESSAMHLKHCKPTILK